MVNVLSEITNLLLIRYFVIFCRIGSCLMVMPGFGEVYVNARMRLFISLILSIIIEPIVGANLFQWPISLINLAILIASELLIGIGIGFFIKILISKITIAGSIISSQTGLSSAMVFDPHSSSQENIESVLLFGITITLMFIMDIHHLIIMGLVESYHVYPSLSKINFQMMAENSAYLLGQAFYVAFKIAAPNLAMGIIFMFAAGVLTRLMPAMQIFFIVMPAQILLGFTIIMLCMGGVVMWYIEYFQESLRIIFMQ